MIGGEKIKEVEGEKKKKKKKENGGGGGGGEFRKYLNNTSGKGDVNWVQKTATLDTAPILRDVLM